MKIDSIKLSGWRSYDLEGIHMEGLKSINLIIGPNNSGKSNLSKYFYYLKSVSTNNIAKDGLTTLKASLEEGQTWRWEKKDVLCDISLASTNDLNSIQKIGYNLKDYDIALNCKHNTTENTAILNLSINGSNLFSDEGLMPSNSNSEEDHLFLDLDEDDFIDPSDNVNGFFDNSIYWSQFLASLVFVDPIRHHSRNSNNADHFYFDGAEIIKELNELRNDDSNKSKWLQFKNQIISWLSDILSEKVTSVEISDQGLRLEFNSQLLFSLDELGTGVSQIVMLLSHLWLNKDINLNVFLEEPEANLHPDSVVKLVSIFENELTNHKFFITTHSPSLIDCLNDNWAVFRTSKSDSGASKITPNDNIIKHYETLDALGVKASQILQANTVIWVEGPSDRIYIKRWIELFSDNSLKEGKDYSFLYFGGTNLASFTVLDDTDQDLINILSTSRKALLIADSDCSSQEARDCEKFKAYLTSMLQRFSRTNGLDKGINTKVEDYFKMWITTGREIENYIPKELLFNVLTSDSYRRKFIKKGSDKMNLELNINEPSDFVFNKFDSFDQAISKVYQFTDSISLDSAAQDNIALSYAGKKVPIAKSIAKKMTLKDLTSFGLETQLKTLVDFIKQ